MAVYTCEPFEPDIFTHGGPSTYPPDRSRTVLPGNIYYGYSNKSADEYMAHSMRTSTASLNEAGMKDGQDLENLAPYVNYALFGLWDTAGEDVRWTLGKAAQDQRGV